MTRRHFLPKQMSTPVTTSSRSKSIFYDQSVCVCHLVCLCVSPKLLYYMYVRRRMFKIYLPFNLNEPPSKLMHSIDIAGPHIVCHFGWSEIVCSQSVRWGGGDKLERVLSICDYLCKVGTISFSSPSSSSCTSFTFAGMNELKATGRLTMYSRSP